MLKAGDKSPTVVLLPCGEASATITDDSGKPLVGYFPRLDMVVTPGPDRFEAAAQDPDVLAGDAAYVVNIDRTNYQKAAASDDQGRITYPALIPGARYRIITYEKGIAINLKEFVAESGKTLELGKIAYVAKKAKRVAGNRVQDLELPLRGKRQKDQVAKKSLAEGAKYKFTSDHFFARDVFACSSSSTDTN